MNNRNPDGTFKKGFSGNTKGRPPVDKSVLEIKKALSSEIAELGKLLYTPIGEATNILTDQNATVLKVVFGKAIKNNDWKVVNTVIERLLGKPEQDVYFQGRIEARVDEEYSNEQKKLMAEAYLRSIKNLEG